MPQHAQQQHNSMRSARRGHALKALFAILALVGLFCLSPDQLYSQNQVETRTDLPPATGRVLLEKPIDAFHTPSLISQAAALALLSLLPFIIMLLTSFVKIVIVLSLLRNALGVQQAPPNQVINGIAFLLSLYVMYPTVAKMYDEGVKVAELAEVPGSFLDKESSTYIIKLVEATREPLRDFLRRNSAQAHRLSFYRISFRLLPQQHRDTLEPTDFIILVPSYITSQLKDAFEIGVLIYIPFFVIDLVTSNILLAMGMMMLSPVTISMPLKLFLLVMLDGWSLLIEGLINTFR